MDKFLGIVQDGRFSILLPRPQCCTVRLTRIAKPASIAEELVASHEINLGEYEGKAIMEIKIRRRIGPLSARMAGHEAYAIECKQDGLLFNGGS